MPASLAMHLAATAVYSPCRQYATKSNPPRPLVPTLVTSENPSARLFTVAMPSITSACGMDVHGRRRP